jgi:hypothetical protein
VTVKPEWNAVTVFSSAVASDRVAIGEFRRGQHGLVISVGVDIGQPMIEVLVRSLVGWVATAGVVKTSWSSNIDS